MNFQKAFILFGLSILLTASCPSWAQALYERFDALEKAAAKAYEGADIDLFEARFQELRSEYQSQHRPQEEIWALYHFDYDKEAAQLESDLKLRLKTEEIVEEKALPLGRSTVRKAILSSGLWVILRDQITEDIGPSVRHDAQVYEVSRALGFHLVPVTVVRAYQDRFISLQVMIRDHERTQRGFVYSPYEDDRLQLLDYLTGQLDRHSDNWLIAPGGHVVAIDNDVVYGHPRYAQARTMIGKVSSDEPPVVLTPQNRRAVERLKNQLETSPAKFQLTPLERASLSAKIETLLRLPSSCQSFLSAR